MDNPLRHLVDRATNQPGDHYAADPYGLDMPRVARPNYQNGNATPLQPQISPQQAAIEAAITDECASLAAMLISKNRQYGNSALNPLRIFSRASAIEQILVRIDDKLSRARMRAPGYEDEDTERDLNGYLILLSLAKRGFAV